MSHRKEVMNHIKVRNPFRMVGPGGLEPPTNGL